MVPPVAEAQRKMESAGLLNLNEEEALKLTRTNELSPSAALASNTITYSEEHAGQTVKKGISNNPSAVRGQYDLIVLGRHSIESPYSKFAHGKSILQRSSKNSQFAMKQPLSVVQVDPNPERNEKISVFPQQGLHWGSDRDVSSQYVGTAFHAKTKEVLHDSTQDLQDAKEQALSTVKNQPGQLTSETGSAHPQHEPNYPLDYLWHLNW